MIRIVLDEDQFRWLVAGREVHVHTLGAPTVALILSDIGWAYMRLAISDAMDEPLEEGS